MSSFSAERLRPRWADGLVLALLLAAALLLLLALRPREGGRLTAVVTLNGEELFRQELDRLEEPVLMEVEGARYPITIEFEQGRARVAHTECPGKDCEHMGWVSRAGGQIVCLPNRLAVTLSGGAAGGAVDGVSG